jgi:hypothetical protein
MVAGEDRQFFLGLQTGHDEGPVPDLVFDAKHVDGVGIAHLRGLPSCWCSVYEVISSGSATESCSGRDRLVPDLVSLILSGE